MSDVINGVPRELLERACSKPKACSSIIEVNRWSIDQRLALGELRALLTAQPQASAAQSAPVVPEGWRLVPVEPTPAMLVAYMEADGAIKRWKAMLAAAPQPSGPQIGECACGSSEPHNMTLGCIKAAGDAARQEQGE